ncbi:MAG: hypothetical protein Q9169_006223 [Polycauliona sp. 2 TL-2023]
MYSAKGWEVQAPAYPLIERHNHPMRSPRRVGDKFSWIIDLDVSQIEISNSIIPDPVLEYANFVINRKKLMDYNDNNDDYIDPREFVPPLWHTIRALARAREYFKYVQVMSPEMHIHLKADFEKATLQSLQQVHGADDRPLGLQAAIECLQDHGTVPADFVKSDTWRYWDSEYPSWYEKWHDYYCKKYGVGV